MIDEFNKRVEEIEVYFTFAKAINDVELNRQIKDQLLSDFGIPLSRDIQKVIRANCYLILYNLIESTIRNGLWTFFDAIVDDAISFSELSAKVKNEWLLQQTAELNEMSSVSKIKIKIEDIINNQINGAPIEFSKNRVSMSGNLDYRSIESLINSYSLHGKITISDKKILAKALLKIKNERNALAHGNKSFRQTAEIITIQDLLEIKNITVQYLRDITNNIESNIKKKSYKKS